MQTSGPGEWYLSRDGQSHGPVTDQELSKLVELGHLKPTDYVWRQGFQGWLPASEVPGLLPPPQQPSAAFPPPFAAQETMHPRHTAGGAGTPLAPYAGGPVAHQQSRSSEGTGLALACYILLLLFFIPIVPLVGLIIALANVNAQPEWVATHHQWQWRTVIKGFLLTLVGLLVTVAGAAILPLLGVIGTLFMLGVFVWVMVRHIRGLIALNRQQPISDVRSWGW